MAYLFCTLTENTIFSSLPKATSLFSHKVVFVKYFSVKFCLFQLYLKQIVIIFSSPRQSLDLLKTGMTYLFCTLTENTIFSSLPKATSLFSHKVVFVKYFSVKFCLF